MAIIDPGKMVANMIKAMGVSQDDINGVVNLIGSLNGMLAEKEKFKEALSAWTLHYDRRLDRIEAMLVTLGATPPDASRPGVLPAQRQLANGKATTHGQKTD